MKSYNLHVPLSENRRCPVPGCDSSGHLSGRQGRHFTAEACPVFHNTTPAACTQASHDTSKRDAARRKALLQLASKSPLTSPSHEHRKWVMVPCIIHYHIIYHSCGVSGTWIR